MTEMKTKRAEGLAPFNLGIRFSTVAVEILGPVTKLTTTRAKHVLVLTDLFTMYTIAVPLVSTDFADVAREIVENWLLKFGATNVLHTDQGKTKSCADFWVLTKLRLLPISRRLTDTQKDTT